MPATPQHYCAAPCCSVLVIGRYCPTHAVDQEHARRNCDLRRLYRTAKWRHPIWGVRSCVLRQQPICEECRAEGLITATQDVHHLQKATRENFFDMSILQALCATHHSRHTQKGE